MLRGLLQFACKYNVDLGSVEMTDMCGAVSDMPHLTLSSVKLFFGSNQHFSFHAFEAPGLEYDERCFLPSLLLHL